jgi:6-phosphogluconolactonase
MDGSMEGAVFVQTNAEHNEVVGFYRQADGTLTPLGTHATGGAGKGTPHLTSQGSVTLTADGRHLLVTNVGSNDVSVLAVTDDGFELGKLAPVGAAPKSVAEHDGLVVALATGEAMIRAFRLTDGDLEPITGNARMLSSSEADGAQVGFSPDGRTVIVTERGTDRITAYAVGKDGLLGEPRDIASSGPTPYGFAISNTGTLVVTEAFGAQKGAAAVSSYRVDGDRVTPVSASVGNGRSEICWAVISPNGRRAFTTNFADGAVSRYAIAQDGSLTLDDAAAGITMDGRPGLRDEALTADGRFLYAIDADQGEIAGWTVGTDGGLTAIGTWGGLPATVAGLAAR